jgi:hypothetical protein
MVFGRASEGQQNYRNSENFCPKPAAEAMRLLKCRRIDGNALLNISYRSVSDG